MCALCALCCARACDERVYVVLLLFFVVVFLVFLGGGLRGRERERDLQYAGIVAAVGGVG